MQVGSRALAALLLFATTSLAAEQRITEAEARNIVREALKARNLDGPTVELNPIAFEKDFYTFEATWPNPVGSPNLGSYSVNPWTGDIWQIVVCRYVTSPSIRKMQQSIRTRFHFSRRDYKRFHAKKPAC